MIQGFRSLRRTWPQTLAWCLVVGMGAGGLIGSYRVNQDLRQHVHGVEKRNCTWLLEAREDSHQRWDELINQGAPPERRQELHKLVDSTFAESPNPPGC